MACCKNKSTTSAANADNNTAPKEEMNADDSKGDLGVVPVVVDPSYRPRVTDGFKLESIQCDGDVLLVNIQYSGGCKDHSFELITNGIYLKSMPPQLMLTLEHQNNGDVCRELINKTLAFNVSGIQYKGSNELWLKVNGEKGKEVLYTYK